MKELNVHHTPEALSPSEARYRAIFENSGQGIAILDRNLKLTSVNTALCVLLGYERQELLSRPYTDFFAPGELERQPLCVGEALSGHTFSLRRVFRRRDGWDVPVEVSVNRISEDEVVLALWDQTQTLASQRRTSQERLRLATLLDAVPCPVWAIRADHSLAFSNTAYRQAFGVSGARACHLGRPPTTSSCSDCPLHQVLMGRQPLDWDFASPDGRHFLVKAVAFQDEDGAPLALGLAMDITDQKRLEQSLTAAREEAQAATQAKSRFLAAMSHEIRTPLNGVLGHLQLIQESRPAPAQAESVRAALGSGRLLMRLIDDILDLSRIESGVIEPDEEDFRLQDIADQVRSLLGPTAEAKGLTLSCSAPDLLLRADATRLAQIAINLVGNGVKYTGQGFVRLEMSVEAISGGEPATPNGSAPGHLVVQVSDSGPGIPAEKLEAVLEPFTQLAPRRTSFGGVGLGLAIVSRLAEHLGGRLTIASPPDRGTRVTVRLPARILPQAAEVRPECPPSPVRPLRILVAEDERVNQRMLHKALERRGHSVMLAGDGREALDLLAQHAFDAVLMDVRMPEMDGLEAVRAMRSGLLGETARRVPVAALTAQAMKGDREACLEAGMDSFLPKPLDLAALDRFLAQVAVGS